VRKVSSWDGQNGARLELLNGDCCELYNNDKFNFAAAQAIHRNLVKVPRWCVAGLLTRKNPSWLKEYVSGDMIACKLCDENLIALPSGDNTELTYRDDLGVVTPQWKPHHAAVKNAGESDDDESYD